MKKNELEVFKAGKIYNKVKGNIGNIHRIKTSICVSVPTRLNTMCFDLKSLTKPEKKFIYNAGELCLTADIPTYAKITLNNEGGEKISISDKTRRKSIVKHAALIMCKTLGIKDSLEIEANNEFDYPHSGLGSSSSLITAVCIAINEMYNKPLDERQITLFIAQNHGEEIDGDDERLVHIQCNGGSPSVALYKGGMQIITGESNMILRQDIPDNLKFVLAVPKFYKKRDAQELMSIEQDQFKKMSKSSLDFSKEIAYLTLHRLMPAVINQNIYEIGEVIKYYRFETGSLKIDSITWNGLYELMLKLIKHKDKDTPIISVSSCGPMVYALTSKPEKMEQVFKKMGMDNYRFNINNVGYKILKNFN